MSNVESRVTSPSVRDETGAARSFTMSESRRSQRTDLDPKRAVSYLRASTKKQELSPAAQRRMIAEWAASEGIEIVAEHLDHGVSGAAEISKRPGLLAALQDLSRLGAGYLLVAKRDRLGRSVETLVLVEREVRRLGGRIVAADGGNGDDLHDKFMRRILDAVAEHERELIRARTKAALRVRRDRGLRVGCVPLGFDCNEDGMLYVNHQERRAAGLARRLRQEGLSLRDIAERLDEAGHRTRTGSPWHPEQVRRLLCLTARR